RGLALDAFGGLVNGVQNRIRDEPQTRELKRDLIQTAMVGLKKLAESSGPADSVDATMADAHTPVGPLLRTLRDRPAAPAQQEQAHAILRARSDAAPDDLDGRSRLAASHDRLGDLSFLLGDRPRAIDEYTKALEIRRAIDEKRKVPALLASSYFRLGQVSEP